MNLSDFAELSVPVTVHSERCIHTFSSRSSCKKCVRACPTQGLKMENGQFPVVEECNGCGRCIQACSLDVFEMDFRRTLDADDEPLVLICQHNHMADAPAYATYCLQQFTWLELAQMLTKHQEVYLFSEDQICQECECQWFPIGQSTMLERNGFGYLLPRLHFIQSRDEFDALFRTADSSANSRRQYLKNQFNAIKTSSKKYANKTRDAYSQVVSQTISQKDRPSFLKTQSMSMKAYSLWKDGTPQPDEDVNFEKLISSNCNFCKVCEQLCPWEAMAIIEEDGHAVLAHHDVLCSRCGLCIDLCPAKGLFWDQGLKVNDFVSPRWRILADADARVCSRCGETFFSTKDYQTRCAICENKL